VSHFHVTEKLGEGGMGEVYRASDSRLGREVAIKVLSDVFARDGERLLRFEREARVLAALNHPNIAAIYGHEEHDGKQLLVLELAEGDDLTVRISHGPMPLEEALPIALQIAEAIEAAHEKGVVHRDLKPANVKVTADGRVKVLDFGLAKAVELIGGSSASGPSITHSPTLGANREDAGVLIGTASYMSPEQARGKSADRRADIWSFGVLLFEMLSSQRLFRGESISETLGAVLHVDPDWTKLPSTTPPALRRLKRRLPDIGSARLELQELIAGDTEDALLIATSAAPRRGALARLAPWALAAALAVTAGLLALRDRGSALRPPRVTRVSVALPAAAAAFQLEPTLPAPPVVSPDGTKLVFGAVEAAGRWRLWVRRLDSPEASVLPGTEDAVSPFWSPDSRSIGFFADFKLKVMEVGGGPPFSICDAPDGKGGTWSSAGVIVFAPTFDGPLSRIPAGGGEPVAVTKLDGKRGETSHRHPRFLPDGRHFLYVARMPNAGVEGNAIVLASLAGGEEKLLLRSPAQAEYASGHILYVKERTLMARPFDAKRSAFTGDGFPIAEKVLVLSVTSGIAAFSSSNDVLAMLTGSGESAVKLQWIDRDGTARGTLGDPADYVGPRLSPDGSRMASIIRDPTYGQDLWIFDVARGAGTRFTFDPAIESSPAFSPDGKTLYYASNKRGHQDLYSRPLDGASDEVLLYESKLDKYPGFASPDGKALVYTEDSPQTKADIWILPLVGDRTPRPFLKTAFTEYPAAFSPDGKWLVYGSDESGKMHLYVTSFPRPGRKWQVSVEEGLFASWSADGKEILYHGSSAQLIAVPVREKDGGLELGAARPLFKLPAPPSFSPYNSVEWTAAPDHGRFLVRVRGATPRALVDLVLNWPSGLERGR